MTIVCFVCGHADEALLNHRMAISVEIFVPRGPFSLIMVTSLETIAGRASFLRRRPPWCRCEPQRPPFRQGLPQIYQRLEPKTPIHLSRAYNFVKIEHIDT